MWIDFDFHNNFGDQLTNFSDALQCCFFNEVWKKIEVEWHFQDGEVERTNIFLQKEQKEWKRLYLFVLYLDGFGNPFFVDVMG